MADSGNSKQASMTVITPEAMLSYPHLFEPVQQEGRPKPEYSCCLVFAPATDLAKLRQAVGAAATEKWGEKAREMARNEQIRLPFRTDVADKYPDGSTFINVKSTRKPEIVSIYAGPDGKPQVIDDEDHVYAGCFVRASLRAFAYEQSGNRGVSLALGNIQKLKDGERLGGFRHAADEFEALEGAQDEVLGAAPAPTVSPESEDPFA